MKVRVATKGLSSCLKIVVRTVQKAKLRLMVVDASDLDRVFTNRYKTVDGYQTFYVRMPLAPSSTEVIVFNEAIGERAKDQETTFEVVSVEVMPLKTAISLNEIKNPAIRSFVSFAQQFAYNANNLETGTVYKSNDSKFFIEYLDKIISKTGQVLGTPARISRITGRIQAAKASFQNFTVPMGFAILMHEFSHYFLNEDIANESEADIIGLLIYLGLGYPRIEAHQAFLETFKNAATEENKLRYDTLKMFIARFETWENTQYGKAN